ncbi:MAG: sulfite exporter TauE/SafE family protein [Candidatus Aminicenantes bacterium]|nr:MAG: sulfite exporter TauE/SafE family protein [Candidatus Aminicenantes bacterium]
MVENVLFLIASFVAAIAATLAGFGSSTLLIPVAIHFMDVRTALFLVACFHLFNNVFKVRLFWEKIDFRTFLLFGIPSIIFSFGGAYLVSVVPIDSIMITVAVFLIVFSLYSLLNPKFTLKKTRTNAVAGGSLSGLLAGLIGLGGAIRSTFLISFNLPKEVYVATSAMIAVVIDLARIPTYLMTKVVQERSSYFLIVFLVASAYLGVKTGKVLLKRINQETFRRIILIALWLVGISILL